MQERSGAYTRFPPIRVNRFTAAQTHAHLNSLLCGLQILSVSTMRSIGAMPLPTRSLPGQRCSPSVASDSPNSILCARDADDRNDLNPDRDTPPRLARYNTPPPGSCDPPRRSPDSSHVAMPVDDTAPTDSPPYVWSPPRPLVVSVRLSHLLPLVVLPLRRLPALSSLPGLIPAQLDR